MHDPMTVTSDWDKANVQKFERVLYSEYTVEFGMDNYINYKHLKRVVHQLESLTPHEMLSKNAHEAFFASVMEQLNRATSFMKEKEDEIFETIRNLKDYGRDEREDATRSEHNRCRQIEEVYIQLHLLVRYRKLNFFGLKKLLQKFLSRCARRSLALQVRVDERYDELFALVEGSSLDIGGLMDYLSCLYAQLYPSQDCTGSSEEEVHSTNYLERLVLKDYRCRSRLVDYNISTFFRPNRVHRRESKSYNIRILAGSANTRLAHDVEVFLGQKKARRKTKVQAYENGEVQVRILENIMGDDVFVVQSTGSTSRTDCSTALMELFLLCNTLTLEGVQRLTAVMPYMSYGASVHGPAIARMMITSGVKHIITLDLAEGQAEGYFWNVPVENIWARKELARCVRKSFQLEETDPNDVVVVSSDSHSVARARAFADFLSNICNAAIRLVTAFIPPPPQEPVLVGSCEGKHCVIVENIIDEGHLLVAVTRLLLDRGAKAVKVVATHGLFSEGCVARVSQCGLQEVIVTDSVLCDVALLHPEMAKIIRVVPIAPILAEAIERIHLEKTLSSVFDK